MITIQRQPDGSHLTEATLPAPQKAMKKPIPLDVRCMPETFSVETLESIMQGKAGDWLITGVNGEMYPCDAAIFAKTYDIVAE